jgi:hypothetical protein
MTRQAPWSETKKNGSHTFWVLPLQVIFRCQNEKTRGKNGNYASAIMTSSTGKDNNPLQFFSLTELQQVIWGGSRCGGNHL